MSNVRDVGSIDMRRTCCGVPVWMLDTTCSSNSRLSGAEKLRSASMLLATCAQSVDNYERVMTTRGKRTLRGGWSHTSAPQPPPRGRRRATPVHLLWQEKLRKLADIERASTSGALFTYKLNCPELGP